MRSESPQVKTRPGLRISTRTHQGHYAIMGDAFAAVFPPLLLLLLLLLLPPCHVLVSLSNLPSKSLKVLKLP